MSPASQQNVAERVRQDDSARGSSGSLSCARTESTPTHSRPQGCVMNSMVHLMRNYESTLYSRNIFCVPRELLERSSGAHALPACRRCSLRLSPLHSLRSPSVTVHSGHTCCIHDRCVSVCASTALFSLSHVEGTVCAPCTVPRRKDATHPTTRPRASRPASCRFPSSIGAQGEGAFRIPPRSFVSS